VVTEPTVVLASNLRHPIHVSDAVLFYHLITSSGEYAAGNPPDIYDETGAPTLLTAELSRGSIVRVSVADDGATMTAVQLITPLYDNPFSAASSRGTMNGRLRDSVRPSRMSMAAQIRVNLARSA
jgi:hypothetical protein